MKYLIGGFLSLLMACSTPSFNACSEKQMQDKILVFKSESRIEDKSREATVKIFSAREAGVGFGTGTVFKYKGEIVVLTAAHVVGGLENKITVSDGAQEVEAQIIYLDLFADLAVLTVGEGLDKKPLRLKPIKKSSFNLGEDVFYSGFPNDSSLLTIRGYIAGMHPGEHLYMHSYGWPGASGSAVLDRHGRLVGVLFAVDVGTDVVGFPTIIEDVIVVVPVWKMNFDLLDMNLR